MKGFIMKTIKRRKVAKDSTKNTYATQTLVQRLKQSLQRCKTETCHIATATRCAQCTQHCS